MIDFPSLIAGGVIGAWVGMLVGIATMMHGEAVKQAEQFAQRRRSACGRFMTWRDFNTEMKRNTSRMSRQ